MYHLGIVRHVIAPGNGGVVGADDTVQAVVRMWDDNLLILGVETKIAKKVKKGNYVLADYTPLSPEARNRKLSITKIIPESDGSRLWAEFQDEFDRRRNMMQQPMR